MFRSSKNDEPDAHSKQIEATYSRMERFGPGSDEYTLLLKQLKKLKDIEKKSSSSKWPSADTLAVVIGGVVQVGIIVGYERVAVMTSKAVGFILKHK